MILVFNLENFHILVNLSLYYLLSLKHRQLNICFDLVCCKVLNCVERFKHHCSRVRTCRTFERGGSV